MITKLTADNAELYYAPRFAEITAAFEAAGSPIKIKSLEDYFLHLTDIAALTVGAKNMPMAYLLVLPADEDIFTIDANSRAISVPAFVKKNGIGVYGDHRAEMIVMTIDRYFDHEDFLNDKIVINWNFTPTGAKVPLYEENQAAAAFAPNEELNPGLITFGFIITKDMTPQKGTLTFSVTIYDDKSNEIVYSFNTLTASVAISDTLTLTDPSIVKNDTDNYVGRLMDSVYTDNTITPVGTPEWKMGDKVNDKFTGLDKVAYFSSTEDLTNHYEEGALLKTYAVTDPNTADIAYKWTFGPVDGTVATAREFETINKASDYIDIELPAKDDGSIFYLRDEMGRVDLSSAMNWTDAKAIADENADTDTRPFLDIRISKVAEVSDSLGGPSADDESVSKAQMNQNKVALGVSGNVVKFSSSAELESFESTNPSQTSSAKWVAFDIDTGLSSIVDVLWDDSPLTEDDVAEAASVNLGPGHIVFWARADVVEIVPRTITITADGHKPTKIVVKYIGVDADAVNPGAALPVVNTTYVPTFCVRGSSYRALSAGNYQVIAQAKIGAGPKYVEVLPGATLKVNTNYYLKDASGEIDSSNPLVNEVAAEAQAENKTLYVLVDAARNSDPIESSVLSVPPAKQPVVVLSVASEFAFGDDVSRQEDFDGIDYVYIDSNQLPTIVATVSIDSDDARDKAGAFATELVKRDTPALTVEEIEQKILDKDLTFTSLPTDGKFEFTPKDIEEGEYVVRAINRRNATYSVSENSDSIHTSFVAPAINRIDVSAIFEDQAPIAVLENGRRPVEGIKNLEINRNRLSYDFEIKDNSENYEAAAVSYFIEEVEYDEDTGEVSARTPDEYGNVPGTNVPYEFYGEDDVRKIEVVQDEEDNTIYRFSINNDPGYYRIKTVNVYHGTVHTAYTDIFGIISH